MTRLLTLITVALAAVVTTAATTTPVRPAVPGDRPTLAPLASHNPSHVPAVILLIVLLGLTVAVAAHTIRNEDKA